MPRSDDWTIHMGPALIKQRARAYFPGMPSKRSNLPPSASHCLASLIPSRRGSPWANIGRFGTKSAARFFFVTGNPD
jgi:hypothetical protein